MSIKSNDRNWTTKNEKEWLKYIGQHNKSRRNNLTTSHALQLYLEASKNRANWGNMDKEEVIVYVGNLLRRELDISILKCE